MFRARRFLAPAHFLVVGILLGVFSLVSVASSRNVYVRGYFRSNGTYVMPHYRSVPDGNFWNNWSTKGNVNPYTGELGTRIQPGHNDYYYSPRYVPPSYTYRTDRAYRLPSYWNHSYRTYESFPRYQIYSSPYGTYGLRSNGTDDGEEDQESDDSPDD